MQKFLIVLTGPTAVGKTNLSIRLAQQFNCDIISSDSRQFYKELNIGTAVPDPDQLKAVKHHFIQNKSVAEYYNAYKYEADVLKFLDDYYNHNSVAILTGGSGLYIDAVCNGIDLIPDVDQDIRKNLLKRLDIEGIESLRFELRKMDPILYNQIDLKNPQRILRALEVIYQTGKPFSSFRTKTVKNRPFIPVKIVLNRDRNELHERINQRVNEMIKAGLLEEVKSVMQYKRQYALKSVGYRELFDYLEGKTSLKQAIELIKRNTRRYARKQITWFRKDENYQWFSPDDYEKVYNFIKDEINRLNKKYAQKEA